MPEWERGMSARHPASTFDVAAVRRRFPSLADGFAYLDAPGGTQVPEEVVEAVATAQREASGNLGAPYATSERVAAILSGAEAAAARFLGAQPHQVCFGANMSSVNFSLSRAAGRDFREGDEILVSALDHDAGVAPWVALAEDRGLVVRTIDIHPDTTLDLDDLESKLSDRTRVVAFAWAANACGTIVDAARVVELAHAAGALAWIDAVHYSAHEPVDFAAVGADVLLCSAYKWCGPHVGIGIVDERVAEAWRPYKVRPSASDPFARRFNTGTQAYELLAGVTAAIEYMEGLGGMPVLRAYERELAERFLTGLPDGVTVYGRPDMEQRAPTFLFSIDGVPSPEAATELARRGYGVWSHDTYYALELYPRLGYDQALRLGFIHYNTHAEVEGVLAEIAELAG
jgi:cysteine desulfurase family protein (TIGR01976 family)